MTSAALGFFSSLYKKCCLGSTTVLCYVIFIYLSFILFHSFFILLTFITREFSSKHWPSTSPMSDYLSLWKERTSYFSFAGSPLACRPWVFAIFTDADLWNLSAIKFLSWHVLSKTHVHLIDPSKYHRECFFDSDSSEWIVRKAFINISWIHTLHLTSRDCK